MSGFGAGLGQIIGSSLAAGHLQDGLNTVNGLGSNFETMVGPYNTFGQSFLSPATGAIKGINDVAGSVMGYDDFMKNYQTSPAAEYQMDVARDTLDNTAAARGGLLSGANLRAQDTQAQGIANQFANQAYTQYLTGNNQQFGQLEAALGNMFQAIGVGQTATGQQAGVTTAQMGANSALAQAQAKNDQGKGSGIGSLFGGLPIIGGFKF